MKKKLAAFLLVLVCVLLCAPSARAAYRVSEMQIDAVLQADGSAHVTQTWTTSTDEGTEFYLACNSNGSLSISDFSVSDQAGPYSLLPSWDVGASFDEKARCCGIVETDSGVELCWGISEYGENRYTIEYVLHGLVGAYSDADGFNYRFVDEMNCFPTDVTLTLRMHDGLALTDALCDIWAFGFDGEIHFEDGLIRAWTASPLESGQHMTVMVALPSGLLSPLRTEQGSFEAVKERAFEGSDYQAEEPEPLTAGDILFFLGLLAAFAAALVVVVLLCVWVHKRRKKKQLAAVPYFRDAPNGGDLNVTYVLGRSCGECKNGALLGAYLLRLICDGSLEPTEERVDTKQTALRLIRPPRTQNAYDDAFYTVLEAAAGDDGVLQGKELARYTEKNAKPLSRFVDSCLGAAKQTLIRGGCLRGAVCDCRRDLTQEGRRQLDEILGLKHFLLDFSLIHERGVQEAVIWQDYMIYALLLGIADKLAPQLKQLYPDALPQIERYERYVRDTRYYGGILFSAYQQEQFQNQMARSSGSGGHVYFGGGGGFSGGGGGGVR